MDLGLSGKRVLVLGASQGLGEAIAKGFLAEGAPVIAAARSVEKIEAWRAVLPQEQAARCRVIAVDLADPASVAALADTVLAEGGVDVLINNGGGPAPGGVLAQGPQVWASAFAAMAESLFVLTARLIEPMLQRGWGRIITVGSSGVEQPIPTLAVSNTIRASVAGWSKSLATEVAGRGVTVNMLLPGRIATPRVASLDATRAARAGLDVEEVRRQSMAEIPAGRYGRPEEFAAVAVFLASEQAGYVTGSMIRVDGGMIRAV
ncbi:SDR family oxidoreductase [Rhodovastum atsumiense]|uniref:SDR family oxidoreductase n=1 Tax=Rhodovastum atsumiense TaxID=504468 RepID=A0A5M6IV63_9PROT|nr:SDR family oxidoreductase [Rhodovastum atsumiense]KAA5612162.1 SDR family oxidoreductase [Rhodovastum atsumiense]CAH2603889.1 SDR family oxidoreductase [Rhodovastum atsumiense]